MRFQAALHGIELPELAPVPDAVEVKVTPEDEAKFERALERAKERKQVMRAVRG